MKIKLILNENSDEELINVSLDSSSTISSWLIDHYFTHIYSKQIRTSTKSSQPSNIIGIHDMYIIYQILYSSSVDEFHQLCQRKFHGQPTELYENYLKRCGLIDLIDLFQQYSFKSSIQTIEFQQENIRTELDRLFAQNFFEHSSTKENSEQIPTKLFHSIEQTISKNYLKHTFCTYLFLLLDTRNEHALIHCLSTPARSGIERQTIVEIRRLTNRSKNQCLTIYQILLTFIRRKELASMKQGSQEHEDETYRLLEKYYVGIKEFFDFIEQLQMTIEENEHAKINANVTFRKLLTMISKQFRKDINLNRCDTIVKEIIEELCQCFQRTLTSMNCTSPIRSASSGGTLAGRRFLRSVAYLCTKQIIDLPIIQTKNEHYESPSTGLRKAASARLLKSPLTPIPIVIEAEPVVEKPVEIPVESVFVWEKKDRFHRRKSQRCLNLSPIKEKPVDLDELSQHSNSTGRQPLGEIELGSIHSSSTSQKSLSLSSDHDQENIEIKRKSNSNNEPAKKRQKKIVQKPLCPGQKSIKNFFLSKN